MKYSTNGKESTCLRPLTFLWIVDYEYRARLHHGATLRYVNYSRELLRQGHRVFFAVHLEPEHEEQSREWFASLREEGVLSDFFVLSYAPPRRYLRVAALTPFPRVGNFVLNQFQTSTTRSVETLLSDLGVDVVLLSDRRFLFLATRLSAAKPLIIDFCDCASLYWARELRQLVRSHQFWPTLLTFRFLLSMLGEDRYYARRGRPLVVASPVDQRALRQIAGRSSQIFTLLNGVTLPPRQPDVERVRNRLIFSGNMDFPPNYRAAMWFLDRVFPLILRQVPDAQFVVAGANPPQFLRERAGGNVVITGHVEDLNREIARSTLFVAPMISGGGFKNKVVEAAANRTCVVATSIAVEFLEPSIRQLVEVADRPEEMAACVVALLRDPDARTSRASALYNHVSRSFTWSQRTQELLDIACACIADVRGARVLA